MKAILTFDQQGEFVLVNKETAEEVFIRTDEDIMKLADMYGYQDITGEGNVDLAVDFLEEMVMESITVDL
jgi:hypothetical protein